MFKELDTIKVNRKIRDDIPVGTKGVIHQVYQGSPNFYLIEFLDNDNNTLAILDVSENDIELLISYRGIGG